MEVEIDHKLYSRQIGAFGIETMKRLTKLRILIMGMKGLGLETSKNIILAGPSKFHIYDPEICTTDDFEYNYYITQ